MSPSGASSSNGNTAAETLCNYGKFRGHIELDVLELQQALVFEEIVGMLNFHRLGGRVHEQAELEESGDYDRGER